MNKINLHRNSEQQISECSELVEGVLNDSLLGMYLYGSFVYGGVQTFSDIDLLVVSSRQTSLEEKVTLANSLLKISGIYGVSKERWPIELTVVVKSEINPWRYPPKFDFMYGDWMRTDFEAGIIEPWESKEHPNLALVITQLLLSHKVLIGPSPIQLLPSVPYMDFIHATTAEISSLIRDIDWDTRNVLLTYARVWSTLCTDEIRSKKAAALWALEKLPLEYKPVLERAIVAMDGVDKWEDIKEKITPTAEFFISKINTQLEEIRNSNDDDRTIKLA